MATTSIDHLVEERGSEFQLSSFVQESSLVLVLVLVLVLESSLVLGSSLVLESWLVLVHANSLQQNRRKCTNSERERERDIDFEGVEKYQLPGEKNEI